MSLMVTSTSLDVAVGAAVGEGVTATMPRGNWVTVGAAVGVAVEMDADVQDVRISASKVSQATCGFIVLTLQSEDAGRFDPTAVGCRARSLCLTPVGQASESDGVHHPHVCCYQW